MDCARSRTPFARFALTIVLAVVWSVLGVAQQQGAPSMVTFLTEPEVVPVGDLVAGRHDLLLIVAIVNPMGPTVYGLDVLHRPGRPLPERIDREHYVVRVLEPVADAIFAETGGSFGDAIGRPKQLALL